MKVSYSNLANAFRCVRPFAGKTFVPWILLECDSERLTMTATDLESWARCSLPAEEFGKARFGIDVTDLAGVITTTKAISVKIEQEGPRVIIHPEQADGRLVEFEFAKKDAADFPSVSMEAMDPVCDIPKDILSGALSKVLFAVSNDNSRPALTGVLFEGDGKNLYFIATDSYRLARTRVVETEWEGSALVPGDLLKKAKSALSGDTVEVRLGEKGAMFVCQADDVKQEIFMRLLSDDYFDYKGVYPSDFTLELNLQSVALVNALERAKIISDVASLSIGSTVLCIEAKGEKGKFGEIVKRLDTDLSEPQSLQFRVQYLLEPLKAIVPAEVQLRLSGEVAPAMLVADDYEYLFMPVLMPVQSGSEEQ